MQLTFLSNTASFVTGDTADTKPGVYLPKTSEQWVMANNFFKHALADIDIDSRVQKKSRLHDCEPEEGFLNL